MIVRPGAVEGLGVVAVGARGVPLRHFVRRYDIR